VLFLNFIYLAIADLQQIIGQIISNIFY